MKYFNSLSTAAFLLAVTSLFSCKDTQSSANENSNDNSNVNNVFVNTVATNDSKVEESSAVYPIAYVNVDSLLLNYDYAKDLNSALLKKQEKSRKELKSKEEKFRADYESMMKKYQAGAYLTEDALRREQENLAKQEQDFQILENKLAQELMSEQQKTNAQLRDTIASFFKIYNADKRYKYILSDAGVLYYDETLDITNDVVAQLNARYAARKKK